LYDVTPPPHPYIRPTTPTHELFYRNHGSNPDINKIIPVVKHYEICEQIYHDLKSNIDKPLTPYNEFFNNKVSLVFNAIERNGIHIDKTEFEKHFHPIENDFVYTQYNLKTTTTRPSNAFGGINYAALNKENGCRKSFIPRNDKFIELDISAYHPNLAARLIDYSFTTGDIHAHFATLYKVDYAKAKELTFKQLYGGVFESYKDIDFVLTHIPEHPNWHSKNANWKPIEVNQNKRTVNIHGHLHNTTSKYLPPSEYCCVSVEQTNYFPITIKEVYKRITKHSG
jgi:hypothetical protein